MVLLVSPGSHRLSDEAYPDSAASSQEHKYPQGQGVNTRHCCWALLHSVLRWEAFLSSQIPKEQHGVGGMTACDKRLLTIFPHNGVLPDTAPAINYLNW